MKATYLSILLMLVFTTCSNAQDANSYGEAGIKKAIAGNFKEAILLFDTAIAMSPNEYSYWIDRAQPKYLLGQFRESLPDFDQSIKLNPNSKESYSKRGAVKFNLSDYQSAIEDFTHALSIDSGYATAYYNRGLVLEKLGKSDAACVDFNNALHLGLQIALQKVNQCNGVSKSNGANSQIIELDNDGTRPKLYAARPQAVMVNADTATMITFLLILSFSESGSGSVNTRLQSDENASIDIKFKNGESLHFTNSPHSQDTSDGKPLLFAAVLNEEAKTMLRENDIETIRFKTADAVYEYAIKKENAGKLKSYL